MNILNAMLKFNLQWYRRSMRDTLFRYKILMLFITLLICPTLASLINFINIPLKSLFLYPVKNRMYLCSSLFFYQIFGTIWISIQYKILFKQPWQKYLSTLPLSANQKKFIDVALLLFIDIIIWIPLLCASVIAIFESSFFSYSTLLIIAKCIVFISLTLLSQISLIKSKYFMWINILIINLCIIFSLISFSQLSQLMIMVFLIAIIYLMINSCYKNQYHKSIVTKINPYFYIFRVNYKKPVPILKIQIKNLIHHSSQLIILFLFMLIISLIAILLMILGKSNPLLPLFLSTTMLINSLLASNLFKSTHMQWQEFSSYLSSLPINKVLLFTNTLIIVTSITTLLNMSITFLAVFLLKNDFVDKIIITFPLTIIFLLASYMTQIKFRRHGLFVSFCLMFVFLYIDHLLI